MSLPVVTTQAISDNVVAQLEASLSQSVPILPKAFCRVLAKVLAAVSVLLWKYASFIFLQLFVAYASMEETTVNGKKFIPLVQWGRLIGVGDPGLPKRAEIVVAVTVTNQVGSLEAGKQLVHVDSGVLYQTAFDVLLNAATVNVTVRAVSDQQGGTGEGTIGNRVAGEKLSFVTPLANVATDTAVVSIARAGVDAETPLSYRGKVIRRFQRKPQGGAYADYQLWAEEVPGIVHAYPYASDLPGEVNVYAEATEESSGSEDGIPTGDQLTAVFDSIQLDDSGIASRRPVNAAVTVLAISRSSFSVQISGLNPDTPETREKLADGIDEYLREREPFIVGLSTLPRQDRVTQSAIGGIVDGIVNAVGATVTSAVVTPGPAATLGPGEKAKLGVGQPTYV